MKITQEVRDFAAKQKQSADAFIAANSSPSPLGEGDHAQHGGGAGEAVTKPLDQAEAEAGMAGMSDKFRKMGGEVYTAAAEQGA